MTEKDPTLVIERLRREIDAIDDQILDLLGQRSERNAEIGQIKAASGIAIFAPARELSIYQRLEAQNRGAFPTQAIRSVFREIISASIALQKGVRVAYLGPQGTYTQQAAIQQFGSMAELRATATISEIFEQVERETCDYGVVPIENSSEGIVTNTLDLLVDSPVLIFAEILIPVEHQLLSQTGDITKVRSVASHAQGLAQCRQWLEVNLPGVALYPTSSTAQAAERASRDPDVAAIASAVCMRLYDLRVIRSGIQDHAGNVTRFLALSTRASAPSGADLTSILFSTRRDEAGTLCRALEPFAENGVNLTRIESRPMKVRAWEYIFFCDFEGHVTDPHVASAIEAVTQRCDFIKVLGSYPRAEAR